MFFSPGFEVVSFENGRRVGRVLSVVLKAGDDVIYGMPNKLAGVNAVSDWVVYWVVV